MKTLIIAEKPSVAKVIQAMLSKNLNENWTQKDGFAESENYFCSFFIGHLLHSKKPDELDEKYKVWKLEHLPILPDKLEYKYTKGNRGTYNQAKILNELSEISDLIINASDTDREGEGIFYNWYNYEGIKKPVKRFWSNSITYTDLSKAWNNMNDGKDKIYVNLAKAQNLRAYFDWLVGMNGTRAYSVKYGITLPVGRVKTSVLSLITNRDNEVENFLPSSFYKVIGKWNNFDFESIDLRKKNIRQFKNCKDAEELIKKMKNFNFKVKDLKTISKTTNPPKPFSMPDLQTEADKTLNYDLDETLKLCQILYEKKLVTYPRTDSPYLPPCDLTIYHELFEQFATDKQKYIMNEKLPACLKNTDEPHTAIIPTGEESEDKLPKKELDLFNLICSRFVTAFLCPMEYDETKIILHNDNQEESLYFRTIFKNITNKGFTEYSHSENEKIAIIADIDKLRLLNVPFSKLFIKEVPKKKPSYFTPGTLVTAMQNVSKNIEEKSLKDILKLKKGLGTSATRDTYPVALIKDGYITKKGRFLISSDKGKNLISIIHKKLKTPELTAQFEYDLSDIEKGINTPENFVKDIRLFTKEIIDIKDSKQNPFINKDLVCPKWGQLTKRKISYVKVLKPTQNRLDYYF